MRGHALQILSKYHSFYLHIYLRIVIIEFLDKDVF